MATLPRDDGTDLEAHFEAVDDGFITHPDQVAAVVRRITPAAPTPLEAA